jgi:hypothetical protein
MTMSEFARKTTRRRRMLRLSLAGLFGAGIAVLQDALHMRLATTPARRSPLAALPSTGTPQAPTPRAAAPTPTLLPHPMLPTAVSPVARPNPAPLPAQPTTPPERPAEHIPAPRPAIITRAKWGAAKPAHQFAPQQPSRITLHHEGVYFDGSTSASDYLRHVQSWSMHYRRWPDIPYHFLLDLEGQIYEGRPLDARGDTNTSYDLQDHVLIAVLGKYDAGEQQPNRAQIDTVIALMAWIADTYSITPAHIHGHREFIPLNDKGEHIDPHTHEKITCPGDNLFRYLADRTIQDGVARVLARTRPAPALLRVIR